MDGVSRKFRLPKIEQMKYLNCKVLLLMCIARSIL